MAEAGTIPALEDEAILKEYIFKSVFLYRPKQEPMLFLVSCCTAGPEPT